MKIHLFKIIEDRSPAVVVQALERCLKQEAWEIQRHDTHVVALGIGTSRNSVNLSDNATFDIDSSQGATTVQVQAEFQHVWFLSEDAQNDTVHARFESIFSNVRAALDLKPEWPGGRNESGEQPTSFFESATPSELSLALVESAVPSQEDGAELKTTQQTSGREVEQLSAISPISTERQRAPRRWLWSPDEQRRSVYSLAVLVGAAMVLVILLAFWLSSSKAHRTSETDRKPIQSMQSTPSKILPALNVNPLPPDSTPLRKGNPSGSLVQTPPSSPATPKDPMQLLEQWADAQRTRDAKMQASFYADQVHPYLALDQASRDTVYEQKKNDILSRKGLWTFKIEDVSVQRQSATTATAMLEKHFMTQKGSVRVSEERISSFLTLKRTRDGWQITGERDHR